MQIAEALKLTRGNVSKAAKLLGIDRAKLYQCYPDLPAMANAHRARALSARRDSGKTTVCEGCGQIISVGASRPRKTCSQRCRLRAFRRRKAGVRP